MQEVIEQPRRLSSTEDCPRFSDIAFDAKVLNGATCTLKRFFQQVDQQKELSCNNATAVLAVYRCLLQKSDNDFVASARAEQKVFKVSQEAEGQRLVSVGEPVRVAAGTRRRLTLSTSMHIVLCIKKVPGSAQVRVHPVTNTIMRQGVSAIQFFTRHPHLVALFQNLCRVDVGRRTYPSKSYEVCTNDCSEKTARSCAQFPVIGRRARARSSKLPAAAWNAVVAAFCVSCASYLTSSSASPG